MGTLPTHTISGNNLQNRRLNLRHKLQKLEWGYSGRDQDRTGEPLLGKQTG
jgi:hypothetical protein